MYYNVKKYIMNIYSYVFTPPRDLECFDPITSFSLRMLPSKYILAADSIRIYETKTLN